MSIHRLIREGRERLGLSESEFGAKVGVSRSAVQQWEKEDGTAPNRSRQQSVAEVLGISVSELMGSTPAPDWPFDIVRPEQIARLSPKDLRTVEKLALSLLEEAENPSTEETSYKHTDAPIRDVPVWKTNVRGQRDGSIDQDKRVAPNKRRAG